MLKELHGHNLAVGQLAEVRERIDDFHQTRFVRPGQHGVLPHEAVPGAGHVKNVDRRVNLCHDNVDGDVTEALQIHADERAAVLAVGDGLNGAFHQLELFGFEQRARVVRRTGAAIAGMRRRMVMRIAVRMGVTRVHALPDRRWTRLRPKWAGKRFVHGI